MFSDSWLTEKRLRAHGFLLALAIWCVYVWTMATPSLRDRNGNIKGTDFLHLYTLGSLALTHDGGALYDTKTQETLAAQRVPEAAGVRYLPTYPPQVSILFAPLAWLSYASALAAWWSCTALVYGVCCYGIWRTCPHLREFGGPVALLALAYPGFFHLIAWGQTSALALASFTGAYIFLRDGKSFLAGVTLGLLAFKPQLGAAAGIVFLFIGAWRLVLGASLSASLQIAAGVAYYGTEPYRAWLRTLCRVPALVESFEPRPYQTHCLRTFWSMLVPGKLVPVCLYMISAGFVLGCSISIWKRRQSLPLQYSALLLASVLVSPHLTVYDLVILAPIFLLLTEEIISDNVAPGMGTLVYAVYILPLLGPIARWTHIQLSVIAMAMLLFAIWRRGKMPSLS